MTQLVTYTCGTCGTPRQLKWRPGKVNLNKDCHTCAGNKAHPTGKYLKHGGVGTLLYQVWCGMKQRCLYPKHKNWKDYGGRGIKVCLEWSSDYSSFESWAKGNGYRKGLILDREDANGDYTPENCRWVNSFWSTENRRDKYKTLNAADACVIKDLARRGVRPFLIAALYGIKTAYVSSIKRGYAWRNAEYQLEQACQGNMK